MFFFFQAEDGIRDVAVTGVQTCALPIFALDAPPEGTVSLYYVSRRTDALRLSLAVLRDELAQVQADLVQLKRSEEHTSELQSRLHLVCRLLLEKKKLKPDSRGSSARHRP